MGDRDEFERCMELIGTNRWTWFLTLKFPLEVSPKYKANREENEEDAFRVWVDEAGNEHGRGSIQFVRVIEKRETGDILFHVLLDGIPEHMQRFWRYRWWELTSGAAWDRQLDNRIEGLIRYFFYKKNCSVEFDVGWAETFCKAATQDDLGWRR